MPADGAKRSWSSTGRLLSQRLLLSRQGQKAIGGEWKMQELINFRIRPAPNLHNLIKNQVTSIGNKYASVITMGSYQPAGGHAASGNDAAHSSRGVMKRPAAGRTSAMKRRRT